VFTGKKEEKYAGMSRKKRRRTQVVYEALSYEP
jgi:predicted transcriptional regulator